MIEPGTPSQYVRLHLTRKQAQAALKSLRWDAEGRAQSNPLWRVIAELEKELGGEGHEHHFVRMGNSTQQWRQCSCGALPARAADDSP